MVGMKPEGGIKIRVVGITASFFSHFPLDRRNGTGFKKSIIKLIQMIIGLAEFVFNAVEQCRQVDVWKFVVEPRALVKPQESGCAYFALHEMAAGIVKLKSKLKLKVLDR